MSEKKKEEKIFKTFRTIIIKAGDEEGVIDMLIPMSTGSVDRHGESIDPKGWKKYLKAFKKRAIMLSSHGYGSLQNQIGEFLDLQVVEEGLFARPKYYINQGNPEADWGHFIATKGKAAFSVGFIPIKWVDSDGKDGKPTRKFTEQELIEISQVTVPSNRDAIQGLQAKSEDPVIKEIIDEIIKDKDFFMGDEKAKYNCECIKCKHKMTSDKHCKDIKCPKCGGTMRRVERPGPGEESKEIIIKPEDTGDYIHIPVRSANDFVKASFRTINIDKAKGIQAVIGKLKSDPKGTTKTQKFIFEKAKGWTMAKAKKWVEDHSKLFTGYLEKVDWDVEYIPEEIDWEEVEASIDKDKKLEKMIEELEFYPEIKYIVVDDEEFDEKDKDFEAMAFRFAEKYLFFSKKCRELERKLKDIELKAGAVLNAKNKKNLKDAQALIQLVLDSAGEEEGQEGDDKKDDKKDDTIISIVEDKKEDLGKDKKTEEKTITIDEKKITEAVTKALNYTLGITER